MKLGRKTNTEIEMMRKNVFARPDFLDKIPSRGGKGAAIAKLAEKMNHVKATEAVVYTLEELKEKFHTKMNLKNEIAYIKSQLRYTHKRSRIRSYVDLESQRVYFWEN